MLRKINVSEKLKFFWPVGFCYRYCNFFLFCRQIERYLYWRRHLAKQRRFLCTIKVESVGIVKYSSNIYLSMWITLKMFGRTLDYELFDDILRVFTCFKWILRNPLKIPTFYNSDDLKDLGFVSLIRVIVLIIIILCFDFS